MKVYVLSPTKLNQFSECKKCFWLEQNKGIKRPAGLFPSLPRGIDAVLKRYFDGYRKQGMVPPELEGTGLKLFSDQAAIDNWRSMFKGLRWKDEAGNVFRGNPDDVLEGSKAMPVDYKTRGSSLKGNSCPYYQLQMDSYTFLLMKNGLTVEDYAYLLFYYPVKVVGKGEFVFDSQLVKINVDPEHAEQVFREAVSCLHGPMPEQGCEYCKNY